MQLVRYAAAARPDAPRLGALLGEGPRAGDVVDLERAAPGRAPAELEVWLADPGARRAAEDALTAARAALARGDAEALARAGALHARRALRLLAPARPGKIVAVARNYAAHAAELGGARERPPEPVLFLKATSAVIGPDAPIELPEASRQVDYEGELAAVIGRPAREVAAADALACVAGYTAANDVSARDFQNVRGQHFIGKSCDGFCPLGPALVTADEVGDPQALALETRVSGKSMQRASTREMIFPLAELIAFASRLMTLLPGDVILTGTPAGVGAAQSPPRWLVLGDAVEVEIERIGCLRNPVRARR
jgi:5-carboxymethyl-2-hydroxymuconate isomerase